jgi:transcriptional regulator with XRE-family HTH domain
LVTVGETLTEARNQAGLSVDELSERTKIRETVICSIERDDYEALGGDLYVRGYIRAIAGAVGIDAQPLIREYDLGREAPAPAAEPTVADATRFDLPLVSGLLAVSEDPAVTVFDLPPVPADPTAPYPPVPDPTAPYPPVPGPPAVAADPAAHFEDPAAVPLAGPDLLPPGAMVAETAATAALDDVAPPPDPTADTRFDLLPVTDDLMAAGYDLGSAPEPWPAGPHGPAGTDAAGSATAIIPAFGPVPDGPDGPGGPREPGGPAAGPGRPRNRRPLIIAAAVAVVVVAGGALGIGLTTGGSPASTAAPAARPSAGSGASAEAASAAAQASASASRASASASAPAGAGEKTAKPAVAVSLPLASARAFGPDGFGDGDDPGDAGGTISSHAPQVWSTQWYATADFGMLKHGTGLLIDLGHQSTVTGIRVAMSKFPGTNLQIRVGNGTSPSDLRLATAARNVGGVVRLALKHPATGRYVLVWFTKLPPDGAGHYAESVSQVMVAGHR